MEKLKINFKEQEEMLMLTLETTQNELIDTQNALKDTQNSLQGLAKESHKNQNLFNEKQKQFEKDLSR